jgi:cobalt-zinc-cadmium efflux system outer membrane protein
VQAQAAALNEVARIDAVRFREGGVAEGVALRTRLEADRAKVAVATAVGELARARSELARTLGVSDRTLPMLAALTAPSLPVPPDSTAAVALAVQARPELAAREAAVREAEARLSAEQRGILGEWQLQGGSKKTAGVMTGQLGLAMPLPLFNRNDGARQRVRGELGEVTASRDDAAFAVRGDAIAALTGYLAVQATAADAATFAQRGVEIATISRTAYREGHASLVELLDAERASADALTARIRWTVEAWMARLELERALGVRLDADGLLDLPLRAALSSTSR